MTKKYRPSNGSEGEVFQAKWCDHCLNDDVENEDYCEILNNSLIFGAQDDGYPDEWIIGKDGHPKCTAFESDGTPQRCDKTTDLFK